MQKTRKVAATTGRFMPPHIGHKEYLLKLVREFDNVVILLGSVYECGELRNCIPETKRVQMLTAIFNAAGISSQKYNIIPISDMPTFEEWLSLIREACKKNGVTHFVTGNKEDILDVLEQKGEDLGFEMINPELDSGIEIHATQIRKLIIEGKWEELKKFIPPEIMHILLENSFREIIAANENRGIHFVPGRQAVDMVLLVRNTRDGKIYCLLGKRSMDKVDFPGYLGLPGGGIDKFELAMDAAIREFKEETGLELEIIDKEHLIVRFKNVPNTNLERMIQVGIYSSDNPDLAGTRGGSSQCFGVFVEDDLSKFKVYLNPTDDLTDVQFYEVHEAVQKGLAYQHGEMLSKAITMFDAYPKLFNPVRAEEFIKQRETVVISFVGASGAGKSTAAYGLTYQLKMMGKNVEYIQEFAKNLYYQGVLGKYIPNQSYIIAQQYKTIFDLTGQVDYIVTDAGLEISALHASQEDSVVEELAWYLVNKTKNVTILIERDEEKVPFEQEGRLENEAESRLFGIKLEKYMKNNGKNFYKVKGSDAAIELALKIIKEK